MKTVTLKNNNKKKMFLTLKELSKMILDGKIKNYTKNRDGSGKLKPKPIKAMYDNFSVEAFGSPTLKQNRDKTYTIVDGHHRISMLSDHSFLNKYKHLMDTEVDLDVTSKNIVKIYRDKNNQTPHKVTDYLSNPDFSAGKYISKFIIKNKLQDFIGIKFRPVLAYYLEALKHENIKNLTFDKVYGNYRAVVNKEIASKVSAKKIFSLSPAETKKILKAMKYYNEVVSVLRESPLGVNLAKNQGLFGFILTDLSYRDSLILDNFKSANHFANWLMSNRNFRLGISILTRNQNKGMSYIENSIVNS